MLKIITNIIDGRKLSREILEQVKKEIALLNFEPVFCDVLVGDDPSSAQYVRMKAKRAEAVGIKFHNANFPATITPEQLIQEIKKINEIKNMCGIIVQLPLPSHIDRRAILDAINPALDVDCLGTKASEEFYAGKGGLGFPTALACMALLDSLPIVINPAGGKKVVVLGYGELVGRPVAALLEFRGIKPEIIRSKTEHKDEIIKNADVIISGIGKGKYITGAMIKEGAVLIDAGTSESDGGIVGDVDSDSVMGIASYLSPVPGGVGPVTVAMLLQNVLKVAKGKGDKIVR
jgi:methylenetetrahydrofolate dehydrogenase (NADP+) / methenyltetrahydrofolate cyclohydrolase